MAGNAIGGVLTFMRALATASPTVLYDFIGTDNYFTESSMYINLGYWDGATTLDQAGDALARVVAEAAGVGEGDVVLDCGSGFGDQDLYWLRTLRPRRIVALDLSPLHARVARRRMTDAGAAGVVVPLVGSATALPFPSGAFDRALAVECAFHFRDRGAFLAEAARVLRPGGTLALADIVPLEGRPRGPRERLIDRLHRRLWHVPDENVYPRDELAARIAHAGFAEVSVRSIRERVFTAYLDHCVRVAARPEARRRLHPFLRLGPRVMRAARWFDQYDYVIARGVRPAD